jgi:ketosteroid isomerase-like protein
VSHENVEVVLASIDAFNRGDVDAQMSTYSADAVAVMHVDPEARMPDLLRDRIEGRTAMVRWLAETMQAWRFHFEPSEIRAVSDTVVFSNGRLGGEGVASGIRLDNDVGVVFEIRDRLIERVEFFQQVAEALRAVGLEE